jgi:hypothetical protein
MFKAAVGTSREKAAYVAATEKSADRLLRAIPHSVHGAAQVAFQSINRPSWSLSLWGKWKTNSSRGRFTNENEVRLAGRVARNGSTGKGWQERNNQQRRDSAHLHWLQ